MNARESRVNHLRPMVPARIRRRRQISPEKIFPIRKKKAADAVHALRPGTGLHIGRVRLRVRTGYLSRVVCVVLAVNAC
jgi:hypothetical protein